MIYVDDTRTEVSAQFIHREKGKKWSLPRTVIFEGHKRPGMHTGARCWYKVIGFRPPRKGEHYLSGAIVKAYKASANISGSYLVVKATHFSFETRVSLVGEKIEENG